jgi:hypothetical protein
MSVRNRSARRCRRTTWLRQVDCRHGEADGAVGGDQAFGLEPTDHLADGRPADLQAVGDAGLDDLDVVLLQLEDALAVLLEGRVMLSGGRHRARLSGRMGERQFWIGRRYSMREPRRAACRTGP